MKFHTATWINKNILVIVAVSLFPFDYCNFFFGNNGHFLRYISMCWVCALFFVYLFVCSILLFNKILLSMKNSYCFVLLFLFLFLLLVLLVNYLLWLNRHKPLFQKMKNDKLLLFDSNHWTHGRVCQCSDVLLLSLLFCLPKRKLKNNAFK